MLVAVVGATVVTAVFDLARTGSRRWARCRRGCPGRRCPGPSVGDVGPLLVAAVGITLVSLTDTIATVDQLRRPPRRARSTRTRR